MIWKSFLTLAALLVFYVVDAQTKAPIKKPGVTLGFAAFYSKPQNEFRDLYKGGIGGEIKGGVGLGKTYVVASMGYVAYAAERGNEAGTLIAQPIKLGVKQYFLAKRLFINGDIGMVRLKDKSMTESERRFTRDIGVGVRLLGLEASVYYDTWDNLRGAEASTNTLLFKLGYNLTL